MKTAIRLAFLSTLLGVGTASGQAYEAVLSLRPVTETGCIAVEIPTPGGQGLSGLTWFHNDGLAPFPRVVLMEGVPGQPPDLQNTALILEDISGPTLAWGDVTLAEPVTSSTGMALAVFFYPPTETSELGAGGGPGLGIRTAPVGTDPAGFYLSADGVAWARYDSAYEVAVQPQYLAGKGKGDFVTLAELNGGIGALTQAEPEVPRITEARLLTPAPNPFNPRVRLAFEVAVNGPVTLEIFDPRGRRVKTLERGTRPEGQHEVIWEGDDDRGQPVASGVYIVKMRAERQEFRAKVTLAR